MANEEGFDQATQKQDEKLPSPRRNYQDRWTTAEVAIQNAVWEIEKQGADERLTEAVILLNKAKDLVSDVVDKNLK